MQVLGGGGVPTLAGGIYLGWGVPTLARGYLPWLGGTYLGRGSYLPWQGVPTLARGGTYLGRRDTYLGWDGVPPRCWQTENITSRRTTRKEKPVTRNAFTTAAGSLWELSYQELWHLLLWTSFLWLFWEFFSPSLCYVFLPWIEVYSSKFVINQEGTTSAPHPRQISQLICHTTKNGSRIVQDWCVLIKKALKKIEAGKWKRPIVEQLG